jgi:hypothetical protein
MSDTFHICESCDTETHEDEGMTYPEAGIFICDTCYGKRIVDAAFGGYDYAAIRSTQTMKADPVLFYTLCKDDPGQLDY